MESGSHQLVLEESVTPIRKKNVSSIHPARKRRRLFRKGKPVIRNFTIDDMGWLWAAYKHGSFKSLPEMNKDEFNDFIVRVIVPRYQGLELIEDFNKEFSCGMGPIGLVCSKYDGWQWQPHVDWFIWSTVKNKLRGTVAYLQKTRWRKDVGVVVVKSLADTKKLFDHAARYESVYLRGKIPNGDPRGDEYVYSSKGNKT